MRSPASRTDAVGAGSTGMHYSFWYALTVEMGYLFEKRIVLQSCRASITNGAQILIVRYRMALASGEGILFFLLAITGLLVVFFVCHTRLF